MTLIRQSSDIVVNDHLIVWVLTNNSDRIDEMVVLTLTRTREVWTRLIICPRLTTSEFLSRYESRIDMMLGEIVGLFYPSDVFWSRALRLIRRHHHELDTKE